MYRCTPRPPPYGSGPLYGPTLGNPNTPRRPPYQNMIYSLGSGPPEVLPPWILRTLP